jgi:hypothetical protein
MLEGSLNGFCVENCQNTDSVRLEAKLFFFQFLWPEMTNVAFDGQQNLG